MRRSFFVFFWYASKALLKRFWKSVEEVVLEETSDIVSRRMWLRGDGVVVVVVVSFNRPGTTSSGGVLVQASSVTVQAYCPVLHAHSAHLYSHHVL